MVEKQKNIVTDRGSNGMNDLAQYVKDNEHLQPLIEEKTRDSVKDEKFSKEFSKQVRNSVAEMNNFFKIAKIETDLQ